jgi:hypothetical protein
MERNVRLGYVGLHYNDCGLPEAHGCWEVIGAIEGKMQRYYSTYIGCICSIYVMSDDYVARNGLDRILVKKQPIDLTVQVPSRYNLHVGHQIKLSVGTIIDDGEKSFY